MRLYEKIIAGKIRYPAYFTPEAKDLLKSLLTNDITKRFGNLANGSRDIFGHVWFQEVDWERLYRKEIPAPYVPKVDGDWDASNFDAYPGASLPSSLLPSCFLVAGMLTRSSASRCRGRPQRVRLDRARPSRPPLPALLIVRLASPDTHIHISTSLPLFQHPRHHLFAVAAGWRRPSSRSSPSPSNLSRSSTSLLRLVFVPVVFVFICSIRAEGCIPIEPCVVVARAARASSAVVLDFDSGLDRFSALLPGTTLFSRSICTV